MSWMSYWSFGFLMVLLLLIYFFSIGMIEILGVWMFMIFWWSMVNWGGVEEKGSESVLEVWMSSLEMSLLF